MISGLRKEEILKSIKKKDISYIKNLAAELDISLSTVRRDVTVLEQGGSIIIVCRGAVRYKAEDFDGPAVKERLIHGKEEEIIAREAVALVEDGDCVYMDLGTTTVGMSKYLQGKRITIASSSTGLLDNLSIKSAKCILLGGEVKDGLESILGIPTEKVISDMYFDKAFIGANGYIPDGGIYTYDDRKARRKVIVKDYSKAVYVLMDTSKKDKYAFSKVFDLEEAVLITEEEDSEDSQVQVHGYGSSDIKKAPV